MLDNDGGSFIELFHQLQRSIGVKEVVIGHRLPVQGGRARYARLSGAKLSVECTLLVRVFPIPEHLTPFVL